MTKSRGINRPYTIWTPEMEAELMRRYPNEKSATIAESFGVPVSAVHRRASTLGVKKSSSFFADPSLSGRTDGSRGESGRIKAGNVPWNNGIKGLQLSPATQFKPGRLPHNTQPIGSYRHDADGTLQRKISNDKGNNSVRWRGVHELVWVEANGPLPRGHIVVFKPGMRTSELEQITLDKVECISLAENMRRNTRHNLPPEINSLIQLRGALNRVINRRAKHEQ